MLINKYARITTIMQFSLFIICASDEKTISKIPFKRLTDEQRLIDQLFFKYDKDSRPVYNASQIVEVDFGLTLILIYDMDEVNQVLTINVWIEQSWRDERLVWNETDFNGLKTLRIASDRLWLPDIVLYNSADDFKSGYMKINAMVSNDGAIFWSPPAKLRSTCKIDITYFPFDDQSCVLKFGSWSYDNSQMIIKMVRPKIDRKFYVINGEWQLFNVSILNHTTKYPCCEEIYSDLCFIFRMRRRTVYYLFNIIFPCLWLTVLSLLGFWLPPDSGEKITLGITVLLAFSVFMLLIAENMPATSEFVPLIGIFLTVTMAMTSLSIVLTVGVLHLHHTGPSHAQVPNKVRIILFKYVAKILRMNLGTLYTSTAKAPNDQLSNSSLKMYDQARGVNKLPNKMSRGIFCLNLTPSRNLGKNDDLNDNFEVSQSNGHESSPLPILKSLQLESQFKQIASCTMKVDNESSDQENDQNKFNDIFIPNVNELIQLVRKTREHYDQISRHLNRLIEKQKETDRIQTIVAEWKMVAYVLDRLLFWIFLTLASSATVIILCIMPQFKEPFPVNIFNVHPNLNDSESIHTFE